MIKVVQKIKPQPWMLEAGVQKVMEILNPDGAEMSTLFVGGAVRNALLERAVEDVDLATKFLPDVLAKKLQDAGVKVIPTGLDHGTVTAICDGRALEITTLRKDVETDGRHAVVEFSQDWVEDARRRDFTMNTLLCDIEGNVYDPLGLGIKALEERRIVFVGNPVKRIDEDKLRILRFFRFHAFYGVGEPDKNALLACKNASDEISILSKERVTQEFFKILSHSQPYNVLSLMFKNNILNDFFILDDQMIFFKEFCDMQGRYGLSALSSRLFVLMNCDVENIDRFERFLLFPKVLLKDMQAFYKVLRLSDLDNDHNVQVAIYKYGRVATAQGLMMELVQDRVMHGYAMKAIDIIQNWDVPDFPISGKDLIKSGMKPGPELGKELTRLENEWIQGEFKK